MDAGFGPRPEFPHDRADAVCLMLPTGPPGETIKSRGAMTVRVQGHAENTSPLKAIEVVVNGEVARRLQADNQRTKQGKTRRYLGQRLLSVFGCLE